jgi:putative heme iron utilization protein
VNDALGPFTPEVVAAIMRHMNVDHAADSVLICRTLGAQASAESAEMTGMDAAGIEFRAMVAGRAVTVRLPWSQQLTERAQVRAEVVRMYQQACAVLGIEPRTAE